MQHRPCLLLSRISTMGRISVYGLTSHLTHIWSFQRQVFPRNWLHWYWQPKTMKQNTTYTRNTKDKQKKNLSPMRQTKPWIGTLLTTSCQEMERVLFLRLQRRCGDIRSETMIFAYSSKHSIYFNGQLLVFADIRKSLLMKLGTKMNYNGLEQLRSGDSAW